MKLNSATVDRTLDQVEATVIPDDHPAAGQLNAVFGDHTFFLNAGGLMVVEPLADGHRIGTLVRVADWNEAHTGLVPHPPEALDVEVPLAAADGGEAA